MADRSVKNSKIYNDERNEKHELSAEFIRSATSETITMDTLLNFVNNENKELINSLTNIYLQMSKHRTLFLDEKNVSIRVKDYMKKASYVTEHTFSCIQRAVNTEVAELFLINTLHHFYTLVYPNNLSHFDSFVELVVEYITNEQDGNICVFDGPHEELPKQFFKNIITGSIIALSILQARKCRLLKTTLYKEGLKQRDPKLKQFKKEIRNICLFFKDIDTTTYENIIKRRFNIPRTKGGRRLLNRRSTANKKRKTHKHHKKRKNATSKLHKSRHKRKHI